MILQTNAIVVRVAPFANTSHVVSWLTPSLGRLATVVKGASRPKSKFLGQYDQFYTCELLFYERTHGNTHIASECAPVKVRLNFRANWRLAACASYLCDITWRVSREKLHQPDVYSLLDTTLDFLADTESVNANIPLWYELRLLQLIGIAPHLQSCVLCRACLPQDKLLLSIPAGGTVCKTCAGMRPEPVIAVRPETVAMLRHWQNSPTPRAALNTRAARPITMEAASILLKMLNHHLDMYPKARAIAMDLICREPLISHPHFPLDIHALLR